MHCMQDPCKRMETASAIHAVTETCCYAFSITNTQYGRCIGNMDAIAHVVLYDALVPILSCLYIYIPNM